MKTIITPKSWADVNIAQYLNYYRSVKPYHDTDDYKDKAILHGIFNFTDIEEEEYLTLPEKNITAIKIKITKLLQTADSTVLAKTFTIDGVKYGFIPSFDEMSYGEYLDLVTYFADIWPNITTIMAILYRPIITESGKTYTIEPYSGTKEDKIELFKNKVTMDIVFSAISFFLGLQNDLANATLTYFQNQLDMMSKENSQLQKALQKSGMGTIQLQYLQKIISSGSMQLPNSTSINV
jgi:hypothetical protein